MPHVFISYVRDNSQQVDCIAATLRRNAVDVWLDRDTIKAGTNWRTAIEDAISAGSYFVACFSAQYMRREETYMNEELTLAIDHLRRKPRNAVWFIPLLLDDSEVPSDDIGGGRKLSDYQAVRMYPEWRNGMLKLLAAIRPKEEDPGVGPAMIITGLEAAVSRFGKVVRGIHTTMMYGDGIFVESRPEVQEEFRGRLREGLAVFDDDVASVERLANRRGATEEQSRIAELSEAIAALKHNATMLADMFPGKFPDVRSGTVLAGLVCLLRIVQSVQLAAIISHTV